VKAYPTKFVEEKDTDLDLTVEVEEEPTATDKLLVKIKRRLHTTEKICSAAPRLT
jgi:hypothetical protein